MSFTPKVLPYIYAGLITVLVGGFALLTNNKTLLTQTIVTVILIVIGTVLIQTGFLRNVRNFTPSGPKTFSGTYLIVFGLAVAFFVFIITQASKGVWTERPEDCELVLDRLGVNADGFDCNNSDNWSNVIVQNTEDIPPGKSHWVHQQLGALWVADGISFASFAKARADYEKAKEDFIAYKFETGKEDFTLLFAIGIFLPFLAAFIPFMGIKQINWLSSAFLPIFALIVFVYTMNTAPEGTSQAIDSIFKLSLGIQIATAVISLVASLLGKAVVTGARKQDTRGAYLGLMMLYAFIQALGGLTLMVVFVSPAVNNTVLATPMLTFSLAQRANLLGTLAGKSIAAMIPSLGSIISAMSAGK